MERSVHDKKTGGEITLELGGGEQPDAEVDRAG